MIEFLLNDEKVTLHSIDPNTTVLQYLREHRQRTGTKEGCASGDCGACTVSVVQINAAQEIEYKSINACIAFVSTLDGKQLLSVEDLQSNHLLHSTQQAMVDSDGSQCGFCTPGFVMSLFTLQKNQAHYDRHKVQQALAGNLCRCTGYKAIDKAAQQALSSPTVDHFDPLKDQLSTQLAALNAAPLDSVGTQSERSISYTPKSVAALAKLLNDLPNAKMVAGGTDLAIAVTQRGQLFDTLIDIHQVKELQQHHIFEHHIEIGATVSLHQCQAILKPHFEDFALLLERFASLQIRNQGTLGGNIANASPVGDTPPALIALGASVQLRKGEQQREVLVADFFVDYRQTLLQASEFIEKIIIPLPAVIKGQTTAFKVYKVSKRLDDDISAICAACSITLDENQTIVAVTLAYGGMAAIAKRAPQTERALLNKTFNSATIESALNALALDFQPLSDFRASREYRLLVAQNLLRKFYIECNNQTVNNSTGHKTRIFDYV